MNSLTYVIFLQLSILILRNRVKTFRSWDFRIRAPTSRNLERRRNCKVALRTIG
ncbi:unnamed protein product [Larinioides sclopetarius]|uniref:Uncharacterized protein n=1 Tax=Larinioides sclopetarius TaxID=280406 RepID=A0AAV2BVW7_9ARAC